MARRRRDKHPAPETATRGDLRARGFKALVRLRYLMDRLGRAKVPESEAGERDALLRAGMGMLQRIALVDGPGEEQLVAETEALVRDMTRHAGEVAPGFRLSDSVCG